MNDEHILELAIEKALRGDREAFGDIYDWYVRPLFKYVLVRVGHREIAEDITEEIFIKAFQHITSYKQRKNVPFSAWLYRIAKNTVIDWYKTHKTTVELPEIVDTHSFIDQLDLKKTYDEILKRLYRLTNEHREVLLLRFIDERSIDEISEILNIKPGTVRVMIFRALQELRKIIPYEKF